MTTTDAAILADDLNFSYGGGPPVLDHLNLNLPPGSRCLLVGANGAGKTTFLRILAGKRLAQGRVEISGRRAYHETPSGLTYLGPEWAANPVVRTDVAVSALIDSNISIYKADETLLRERVKKLLTLLDIDLSWRLHQVSDGERRRVQILLGLINPFSVLLLDEVTVDLDVLVRRNLLDFLQSESEDRNATILYATHIFDGLGSWPTHLAHMRLGQIVEVMTVDQIPEMSDMRKKRPFDSPLLLLVEMWLRSDFEATKKAKEERNKAGTKWDKLSEDVRTYGDKFYNYWK